MYSKYSFLRGAILYFAFWIILAEKIDFQIILIGIFITAVISFYNLKNREGCYKGKRLLSLAKCRLIICYLILLIKEIVIASFQVAKIVLSKELNISPSIVRFKSRLKGDLLKTILANSITLTPGTITIEINGDEFTVHCISSEQIEDVIDSKFEELLLKIEEQ